METKTAEQIFIVNLIEFTSANPNMNSRAIYRSAT